MKINSMTRKENNVERVNDLLSKMTLEEKVGQMTQYNGFWNITGPAPQDGDAAKKYADLRAGRVGSMLNVRGVMDVRRIQEIVVNESRLGIPLIFGFDVIHGHKTLAPIPLAESASWDLKAIENSAKNAAREAASEGLNWTFAPMVDIGRDARWGRVMEGGGEDPYLGSKIAAARVRGFQGDDLSSIETIAACAKHFAGYGFAEAGKDYNTVDIGTSTLYNVVLPPFKAAVDSGVRTLMNSFNILNGIPATGDKFLQRDILKEQWGFNGFVISDWASGGEMVNHGFARDLKHAAELAANAGSDMDMESYAYNRHLTELVKEGKVAIEVIDEAVSRILHVKFDLGLMDDPYKYCDEHREREMIYHPTHMADALDMAKKSIVLLKNEKGLLPLNKDQRGLLVVGELAAEKNSPLGSWRLGSEDNTAISVLEGLDNMGISYSYERGPEVFMGDKTFTNELQINDTNREGIEEAVEAARKADMVLMVLGEHGFQSGEGRSRTKLGLPGLQQELLEAVYAVNENIVLLLTNGRPLTISWAADNLPAILECWQLGTQSGHAIAQVLTGDYNPSGKLPMTFPRSVGQVPISYSHYSTGRPEPTDVVFWTHYIDETNEPLFPFGFGLSYTAFDYDALVIDDNDQGSIKVSVQLTNTGSMAGEEVAQLYIHDKVASVVRPIKELKGFEKLLLQPGETKTVEFKLTPSELGFYNNQGEFVIEPGEFRVMVGGSSSNGLVGSFQLTRT